MSKVPKTPQEVAPSLLWAMYTKAPTQYELRWHEWQQA